MPVLEKTQVLVLLKNLFRLIRASGGQPVPSLIWLGENHIPIQDFAKRVPALNIEGVINDHIATDIPTLRKLLDSWLHLQPKNTRGYNQITRAMTEFLAAQGQRQKMQYIAAEYPNTLGLITHVMIWKQLLISLVRSKRLLKSWKKDFKMA